MIRSMTGFGSALLETEKLRAAATVRSLNHRYLEVAFRTSPGLATLEPSLRERVQERVRRGRVEVRVQAVLPDEAPPLVLARSLATQLIAQLRALATENGLSADLSPADIARFPGVIESLDVPQVLPPACQAELVALLDRALSALDLMRRAEGENLAEVLRGSLDSMAASAGRIAGLAQSAREAGVAKLVAQIQALVAELGLDETRVYQEVARLVERSDVSEELARLGSHVAQARTLLSRDEPCGKVLDFLAQELLREANTIGSKASAAPVIQEVVALKAEIERFREQVQNVE